MVHTTDGTDSGPEKSLRLMVDGFAMLLELWRRLEGNVIPVVLVS